MQRIIKRTVTTVTTTTWTSPAAPNTYWLYETHLERGKVSRPVWDGRTAPHMSSMFFCMVALIAGLVVVALGFLAMYNNLIGKRNQADQAFSSVDVMLKKRYELIPNLVATVEKVMTHERSLLVELTTLRTRAIATNVPPERRVELDNQISSALSRLLLSAESYPQIQVDENFLNLQGSLNEVEEQISAARRAYNAAITEFNNAAQMFPSSIVAGMIGLKPRPLFAALEIERQNLDVRSLFRS